MTLMRWHDLALSAFSIRVATMAAPTAIVTSRETLALPAAAST